MATQSKVQKGTVERVMHEFKHGDLRIRGNGPKVTNPRQAIAIALREAGASNQKSPKKNRQILAKTKAKGRKGEPATPGERLRAKLGRAAARAGQGTRAELYAEAKRRDIAGRSRMSKAELERVLWR